MRMFMVHFTLLLSSVCLFTSDSVWPQKLQDSAHTLREELKKEQQRAKELEAKKKQLESLFESHQKSLQKYENILYNYRYNLEEAQKIIDAAESEIQSILKRRAKREELLQGSIEAYAHATLPSAVRNPAKQMQQNAICKAAAKISRELFREMQAEAPRLDELRKVIDERMAYQARIVNEYMPADIQRMEQKEQTLSQTEEEVKTTRKDVQTASQKVESLRKQVAAAEEKLAEIRRQRIEEDKKRKLAKVESPQPKKLPFKESEIKPLSEIDEYIASFSTQRGDLNWPAAGTIVRPFGEFTHPEFQVKMVNHGIDVQVPAGSTLRAAAAGRIQFMGSLPSMGNTLILDHGQDFMTIYSNIQPASDIHKGVAIQRNHPLGTVQGSDSRGQAIYHFEVRKGLQAINPEEWLQSK